MTHFLFQGDYVHSGHMASRQQQYLVTNHGGMFEAASVCPKLKDHVYGLDALRRIAFIELRNLVTSPGKELFLYRVQYQRNGQPGREIYLAYVSKAMADAARYANETVPKYDELLSITYMGKALYHPFSKEEFLDEE